MDALTSLLSNGLSVMVLRKIMFAVHHLPRDTPSYWRTVKEFAKAEVSINELQTAVENLEYLNQAAFHTDKQLLDEFCEKSIGIVLISSIKKCHACGSKFSTRADHPRKVVLYTESSGTLPALHYRKVCSRSYCNCVQHYGFHSLGKFILSSL